MTSLLDAYRRGYFPMAEGPAPWNPSGGSRIHWFSPDPRGVLPLTESEGLHVSRRLEDRLRRNPFALRVDVEFAEVMAGCAERGGDDDTWIDSTVLSWYGLLHEKGHAHSLAAFVRHPETGEQVLVGGIYGVSIGSAFFGESMFHRARARYPDGRRHPLDGTDASKVCLVVMVRALAAAGYTLFDTQMVTDHVARFGGREIPRAEYLRRLDSATDDPDHWPGARDALQSMGASLH